MSETRQATVRLVPEEKATGKVAAVYSDLKATKKLAAVPNFWRALATNPDHLEMVWTRLKALMHPEAAGRKSPLDPVTREAIALRRFHDQRLRVLHQLAYGGAPQVGPERRGRGRGPGHRQPF